MCEVLWPHTHVMVDVPCGYSFLLVNQYSGSGYSLLTVMVDVPCKFDRLGAMIKSVIFVIIGNFTQVWFMRPSKKIFSC